MKLWVNGAAVTIEEEQEPLLQLLRRQGLTGAKEGCGEGECGACLVVIQRPGPRYVPVNACLLPAGALAGERLITVEGLAADGELHPVQQAMAAGGGSQCGYCTPGFVMALFAEYYHPVGNLRGGCDLSPAGGCPPERREGFDREALSGNLCRCTGYRPIVAAGEAMGRPSTDDPWLAVGDWELERSSPEAVTRHYPANSPVFRPTTLPELFQLRATHPGALLLAGGTDLGVELSLKGRRFPALIALDRIPDLQTIREEAGYLELGAAIPLTELRERLGARVPLLAELFPLFASLPIRNRATLGGNLATASPVGDGPPVLLALGAVLRLVGPAGERLVELERFFRGYRETALAPEELIAGIRIPLTPPSLARFYKVAKRQEDDIATVSAAFAIDLAADGTVQSARLAFGGVAATPVRARETERALVGRPWSEERVNVAAAQLGEAFQPLTDQRGSAAYRRALLGRLLQRFYHERGGGAR